MAAAAAAAAAASLSTSVSDPTIRSLVVPQSVVGWVDMNWVVLVWIESGN